MIRVICFDISGLTEPDFQALYENSAPERRARADRCRLRLDALRCVASDGLLRYALGTADYAVERTPAGKPYIRGREDFHFNLSHAGNWVVLACGSSPVGVDVEDMGRNGDIDAIARRFFTPEEQGYVLEGENRCPRFFEVWTGKESYLKFLGTGLRKDPASFSIFSLEPGVCLHRRMLDESHLLCLCTTGHGFSLEFPGRNEIIKP